MPETKVKHVLCLYPFIRKKFPPLGFELICRVPGDPLAPEILTTVSVPHVQPNVSPFGNQHSALIIGLYPGILSRISRQKIEGRSEAERFLQDPVQDSCLSQIFRGVIIHVPDLLINLILNVLTAREVRECPTGERGRRLHGTCKEDLDVAAQSIIRSTRFEIPPQTSSLETSGKCDVSELLKVSFALFENFILTGQEPTEFVNFRGNGINDDVIDKKIKGRNVPLFYLFIGNMSAEKIINQHFKHHYFDFRLKIDLGDLESTIQSLKAEADAQHNAMTDAHKEADAIWEEVKPMLEERDFLRSEGDRLHSLFVESRESANHIHSEIEILLKEVNEARDEMRARREERERVIKDHNQSVKDALKTPDQDEELADSLTEQLLSQGNLTLGGSMSGDAQGSPVAKEERPSSRKRVRKPKSFRGR